VKDYHQFFDRPTLGWASEIEIEISSSLAYDNFILRLTCIIGYLRQLALAITVLLLLLILIVFVEIEFVLKLLYVVWDDWLVWSIHLSLRACRLLQICHGTPGLLSFII